MPVRGPAASSPVLLPLENPESGYRVKSGDTLWSIARQLGLGLSELLAANPHIKDPNRILAGQQLLLPSSTGATSSGEGAKQPNADGHAEASTPSASPSNRESSAATAAADEAGGASRSSTDAAAQHLAPRRSVDRPPAVDKVLALPPATRVTVEQSTLRPLAANVAGGRASTKREGASSWEVERLDGSRAKVTLSRRDAAELAAGTKPLAAGAPGAAVQASREAVNSSVRSYTVDLATPAGRKAYDALAKWDLSAADHLVDGGTVGVERTDAREGFVRAHELGVQARVRAGNADLEASRRVHRRVERDLAGAEHRESSSSTSAGVTVRTDHAQLALAGTRAGAEELHLPVGADQVQRDVPRSAAQAVALPERSSWKLSAEGSESLSARQSASAGADFRREHAVRVEATRGSGKNLAVDAVVKRAREGEGQLPWRAGSDGIAGGASLSGTSTREQRVRAALDLARPEHAAAYDALVRGDVTALAGIAREQGTLQDDTARTRAASGNVSLPEGGDVSGTVRAAAKREVRANLVDGSRVEKGELSAEASLSTKVGRTTLGFDPGQNRSYELTLPAGSPASVVLPTDATRARALPTGARFTLEGEGRLGASVATSQARAGASTKGTLHVDVERREGDAVDLRVRLARSHSVTAEGTVELGRSGRPSIGLQASRAEQRRAHEVAVTLDLSNPDDRAAYDAALQGNTAPAVNLAAARGAAPPPNGERAKQDALGASLQNVEGLSVEGSLARDLIPTSDLRIQADDDRRASTQTFEAAGKKVEWQETRARGALGADVTKELPIDAGAPGNGTLGLGFTAGKSGSIRVLGPVVDGHAPRAALPTRAADALTLPRGTEVEVVGEGNLGTRVKAAIGGPIAAAPGVALAGSVSVSSSRTQTDRFAVTVKRGEGNSASVSIIEAHAREKGNEVGVKVGLTVDPTAVLGAGVVTSLPAIVQRPVEGALGKAVGGLNDKANVALTHGTTRRSSEERGLELRFEDLTKPDTARAYAEAVRGRPEAALDLAARARIGEDTGVRMVSGHEEVVSAKETQTRLAVGGNVLFLREALRQDKTQIVQTDAGSSTTQTSTYQAKSRNLLGGRKEMLWEAVAVRTPEDPAGQRFYRMTFDQKDPMTSRGDVARVKRLAEELGAAPARDMKADGQGGLASLVGAAMGKTRTEMEVFVTPAGMDKIRASTSENAFVAYGRATAAAEGDEQLPPWARSKDSTKARALLEEYDRHRQDHRRGDGDDPAERVRMTYWHTYKRNIWDDADNYKRAQGFVASVERMRSTDDPGEWNKAFAELGKQSGFQVAGALGAMNTLAGADELLVHRLKMTGSRVDIEMKDEGLLEKPEARATLPAASTGTEGP